MAFPAPRGSLRRTGFHQDPAAFASSPRKGALCPHRSRPRQFLDAPVGTSPRSWSCRCSSDRPANGSASASASGSSAGPQAPPGRLSLVRNRSTDLCVCAVSATAHLRRQTAASTGVDADIRRSFPFLDREHPLVRLQLFADLTERIGLVGLDRQQLGTPASCDAQTPFPLPACRLAGKYSVVGDRAHRLNGAEDRGLVDQRPAVLAQSLRRQAMLPQADRRAPQIAVAQVVISAIGAKQIDSAEVPRVIADNHRLGMADPGSEHVCPIGDRVQRHAVAPNPAARDRQEVDQEAARIGHRFWLAATERRTVAGNPTFPGGQRRRGDATVQVAVIDARDCMAEPAFDFIKCHRCRLVRIQIPLRAHVGERGPRQQMNFAHHSADQPLDMAAIMRRPHRAVVDGDAILVATAFQCFGAELLGVVQMQPLRDAARWPQRIDAAFGQPALLGERRMTQAQRDGGRRRRLQRQMEADNTTRADINCQRQPRALNRRPGHAVDHDHIDQRVINLDQRQRPVGLKRTDRRQVAIASRLAAFPFCNDLAGRAHLQPRRDRFAAWNDQTCCHATPPNFIDKVHKPWPLARQIYGVNQLANQRVDLLIEQRYASLRPATARQQAGEPRIGEIAPQQRIGMGRSTAEFGCGRQYVASRAGRILRQSADHRQIAAGFVPRRYIDRRYLRCAHGTVTRVSVVIGIVRSTTSAPRAISRQTTARPASRDAGSTSTNWPKLVAWPRANVIASSANTTSTGAFLSGSNRFAASSSGPRIARSVAILNLASLLLAQSRAAAKAGRSRLHPAHKSARYLTSTMSVRPSLQTTRKSGVYRRCRPSCSKWIVTGCAVNTAPASAKLLSVTKSRSSALSCSVNPVARDWNPVTCERRLNGMRRKSPSIWKTTQYAILAHFEVSSQTWSHIHGCKSLSGLMSDRPPIHETSPADKSCRCARFRELVRGFTKRFQDSRTGFTNTELQYATKAHFYGLLGQAVPDTRTSI